MLIVRLKWNKFPKNAYFCKPIKNNHMKLLKNKMVLISAFIFTATAFVGCIKDELPNAEADILDVVLSGEDNDRILTKKIDLNSVTIFVEPTFSVSNITPIYTLSEGARIVEGGDITDFTSPQNVKVLSEDGKWSKTYRIIFAAMELPTEYKFDYWEHKSSTRNYEECFERVDNGYGEITNLYMWASGNSGYAIANSKAPANGYPTFKTGDCQEGLYAACMQTLWVGPAGQGSPIAAGSLFIGEFSGKGINIMREPMKATRFGLPFNKKPKTFKFFFKYKAVEPMYTYDDGGNKIALYPDPSTGDTRDYCAAYAILFDNVKAAEIDPEHRNYLDGSNILSSAAEVGRAILTDNDKYGTGDTYVYKEIPFTYSQEVDPVRLANYEYSLAIVFSSSYYGASFIGGLGSMMWVDNVTLECYPTDTATGDSVSDGSNQ